jgi:hypothetical protein
MLILAAILIAQAQPLPPAKSSGPRPPANVPNVHCVADSFGGWTCSDGSRVLRDSNGGWVIIPGRK